MNKDIIQAMLDEKLAAKLQEKKTEVVSKMLSESDLVEDHFSDKQLEALIDQFEKDMNHEGAKAIEDYIQAEVDGNKGKAALAAAKIKKAMKK